MKSIQSCRGTAANPALWVFRASLRRGGGGELRIRTAPDRLAPIKSEEREQTNKNTLPTFRPPPARPGLWAFDFVIGLPSHPFRASRGLQPPLLNTNNYIIYVTASKSRKSGAAGVRASLRSCGGEGVKPPLRLLAYRLPRPITRSAWYRKNAYKKCASRRRKWGAGESDP